MRPCPLHEAPTGGGTRFHNLQHAAGDYRTSFKAKAEAIADALQSGSFDFAFLHVKAVDDTGHDRLPWLKVYLIACCPMGLQGPE